MERQKPEHLMWNCPLCSTENKVDAETYKVCSSCGWGKKMALPEKSKASIEKNNRFREAAKSLAAALFIATGLFAKIVPVGVIVGRVGCLLEECCLGVTCKQSTWWTCSDTQGVPRWPAVPLEILFNIIAVCGTILLSRQQRLTGQHFHLYLIGYGLFRFIHEFWRATPNMLRGLSGYQIAALLILAFALVRFQQRRQAEV